MKEHVIINKDRTVTVPESVRRIGIQYDHNVNKITFDCPRYADDNESIDLSRMAIYINFMLPNKTPDFMLAENVTVDETDSTIMHFDWRITNKVTPQAGVLSTLICIKQTDSEGLELYHWNTDLIQRFIVGTGMECDEQPIVDQDPEVITQILTSLNTTNARIDDVEGRVDELENGLETTNRSVSELKSGMETTNSSVSELKGDITRSKEAIKDLSDKKITKFYASNLGETTLNDSDNGKITDMFIFGKSYQYQGDLELEDGTTVTVPNPDYPQEIQSVVNPSVKVCGKNLFDISSVIKDNFIMDNGGHLLNESWDTTNFIECNNDVYTLSEKNKGNYFQYKFAFYDFNKKYLSVTNIQRDNVHAIKITKPKDARYLKFCYSKNVGGNAVNREEIQLEIGKIATSYEPYKPIQKATLPYTMNAIPVSSGGNVTIDGQEYIADYVDIENKKLVRMTELKLLDTSGKLVFDNTHQLVFFGYLSTKQEAIHICTHFNKGYIGGGGKSYYTQYRNFTSIEEAKEFINNNEIYLLYELATPTIIDLTDEEVQEFIELATYYPTTNVIVTSDQLDGYTTFNYPISMENGWNYVKEQIGDTREYIYDMELQSAEAYVNSEYAVALAELEV